MAYDETSTEISAETHAHNMAILEFIAKTGLNPLVEVEMKKLGIVLHDAIPFSDNTTESERLLAELRGVPSHTAATDMQYDGFVDLDAWAKTYEE
jgi:hypothetical protein